MAYSALFNNVFEALNLLLIILCSRNSATWQCHLAPIQNTEFWLQLCHGWLLVQKVQMLYASSLQLTISAEIIQIASHFKLLSEYKT
jgi:hypothetical protein